MGLEDDVCVEELKQINGRSSNCVKSCSHSMNAWLMQWSDVYQRSYKLTYFTWSVCHVPSPINFTSHSRLLKCFSSSVKLNAATTITNFLTPDANPSNGGWYHY